MNSKNMIEKAIKIALSAHSGQVDKGGNPYIFHPLRVMLLGKTDEEKICGVLHDVVEDTDITIDSLREEGFSEKILNALEKVTRNKEETYDEFINRISKNPLAIKVKLNDLSDNMNLDRIPNPTQEDLDRVEKYKRAYARLTSI